MVMDIEAEERDRKLVCVAQNSLGGQTLQPMTLTKQAKQHYATFVRRKQKAFFCTCSYLEIGQY